MLRNLLAIGFCLGTLASAQQPAAPASSQPKVKVNVLNVCTPTPEEQKELASALERVPKEPLFSTDFEVDRGRSTMEEPPGFLLPANAHMTSDSATADWVRIRREFAMQALFSTVQYSFSQDTKNMVETVVFHARQPKDLLELSIEDSASAVTSPADMLGTDTPATHIKLERFGKSSVVLARCSASEGGPPPDQSAYEPLFGRATAIVSVYRQLLKARQLVPDELTRLEQPEAAKPKPASKLRRPAQPQR